MHVPFFDLTQQTARLQDDFLSAISAVISSGQFCLGPAVDRLETAFAKYCETEFCVAVNSGTSALHLALDCLDIQAGDEVITTPATFVATSWAIRYLGATPVFVDIDPTTRTLDATKVEAAITPRTKAILPVHLYGRPADMFPILEISQRREIPVIEDAAQAHGARYFGRRVGGLGHIGCFSFYPSKNLGALGEGGALVTSDPKIAARAQALRSHAQFDQKNRHDRLGYNYRMDACQAAVLHVKLRELDAWNELRRKHARQYLEELANIEGLQLPDWDAHAESVFHLFVVAAENRDALAEQLRAVGVDTGVHYPIPVHLQPAFADLQHATGSFPVAERLATQCLSLPMFPEMTSHQVRYVTEQIRRLYKTARVGALVFSEY